MQNSQAHTREHSPSIRDRVGGYIVGGVLVWGVPFAASMLFYDRNGELTVDVFLFKSIMIVLSVGFGGWLLLRTLGRRSAPTAYQGLVVGVVWMVINWGLDAMVLLPLTGMGIGRYAAGIGLRYFAMPIQGALLGAALERSP